MKKLTIALVVAIIFTFAVASPAMAVGDKVHGDKADGPAYQYQETGLPDWGSD